VSAALHIAADIKHPDNMTRKEKLQKIASLRGSDAAAWWLRHAPEVSRKAFNEAAGR